MKLTKEQLQTLFTELGIAQAVEIVSTPEEAERDFNPTSILKPYIEAKKPVFMAEFEDTILPAKISAAAGEFGGKLNGYIRKASDNQIPLAELEKLNDQEKIQKLVELLNTNKGKDTEELRNQITETIENHNRELDSIREEYERKLKDSDSRLNDYKITEYLSTKVVPGIPLVDGDLKIRTSLLKSALSDQFNLVMNENNELELRDRENVERPVLNKEKTAVYKPEEFANEFFAGLGIVKTDNRGSGTEVDGGGSDKETKPMPRNVRTGMDKTTEDTLAAL